MFICCVDYSTTHMASQPYSKQSDHSIVFCSYWTLSGHQREKPHKINHWRTNFYTVENNSQYVCGFSLTAGSISVTNNTHAYSFLNATVMQSKQLNMTRGCQVWVTVTVSWMDRGDMRQSESVSKLFYLLLQLCVISLVHKSVVGLVLEIKFDWHSRTSIY